MTLGSVGHRGDGDEVGAFVEMQTTDCNSITSINRIASFLAIIQAGTSFWFLLLKHYSWFPIHAQNALRWCDVWKT